MQLLDTISNQITIVLLALLLLFMLIDNMLTFTVNKRKSKLENKYYEFHYKYGIIKTTLAKLVVALYIVYALLAPTGSSGALAAPIWAYGYFIAKLFFDLIKNPFMGEKDET